MNKKAEKFLEYLQTNNIACFQEEELPDEFNTVAFRSTMDVLGQVLPIVVITDNTIYSLIRVRVASNVVNEQNEAMVRKYIDELNKKFKLFKYYIQSNGNSNGDLIVDICMPSMDDSFSALLVHSLIGTLLKHLIEEYPTTMKYIWYDWSEVAKTRPSSARKISKSKIVK